MKKTNNTTRKTYWSVRNGWTGTDLYFKDYTKARDLGLKDFYDPPVKHTVKAEKFDDLESVGAFVD